MYEEKFGGKEREPRTKKSRTRGKLRSRADLVREHEKDLAQAALRSTVKPSFVTDDSVPTCATLTIMRVVTVVDGWNRTVTLRSHSLITGEARHNRRLICGATFVPLLCI